ncbi:TIGR03982 family His-Xaa-Ser system protein [Vibrio tetraodonis]|uniref:TIGR03982 family His-Xaa-Ser system protein n=1 Tax=Vibrio tetraodonis TaxID=2231647 RepID=UPI000E0BD3C4|nr:TIGR03982 family His-Xaa-Ser system protein [Vibrio tetraodonis]
MGWSLYYPTLPIAIYSYYKNDFMVQTAECSLAMDETWYIEQVGSNKLNQTAQVHLIACHEYDKTRKIMLAMRVPEAMLGYLGLEAIELHQRTIKPLTEQHKFLER